MIGKIDGVVVWSSVFMSSHSASDVVQHITVVFCGSTLRAKYKLHTLIVLL